MRYFILALFLATPAFAAELPSLSNSPYQSPSGTYAPGSQSYVDTMRDSRTAPEPVYVPVQRQEQPSMLNQGGLQRGW